MFLELLWQELEQMFEHDRLAARGKMATRALYVFKHDSELGNANAHALFDHIKVKRKDVVDVPRSFGDYKVSVVDAGLAAGVSLIKRV
jgi:CRISPR-associated protein Csd2